MDILQYAAPEYPAEFLSRLKSGFYLLQDYSCPLSKSSEFSGLKVATSQYGFEWQLSSAGLLQMNKRFTEESLTKFYTSGDYRKITMGGASDADLFALEHTIMSKYFIEAMEAASVGFHGTSILELGCGSGGILLALKERGARVTGVDLDEGAIKYGKQYLEDLHCGDAHNFLKNVKYDVVILSNVLEHLNNPLEFLLELSRNIDTSHTKIIIDVPNLMGAEAYSDHFNKFLHCSSSGFLEPLAI